MLCSNIDEHGLRDIEYVADVENSKIIKKNRICCSVFVLCLLHV